MRACGGAEYMGCDEVNEVKEFGKITAVPKEENTSFMFAPGYNTIFSTDCLWVDPEGEIHHDGWRTGINKDLFIEVEKGKTPLAKLQYKFADTSVEELKSVLGDEIVENSRRKAELEKRQAVENKLKEADSENRQLGEKQKLIKLIYEAQKENLELDELLEVAKSKKEI